jgi:hypothetical protein
MGLCPATVIGREKNIKKFMEVPSTGMYGGVWYWISHILSSNVIKLFTAVIY